MGTFNGERYVTEQLETVMGQTHTPDEIIVCDDGSTDGTLDRVERMRRSSAIPIRIVRNRRRLGFSDNFLNGASMAKSEYLAFCDQDDRWYPEKLETALRSMVRCDALLSAHAVDLIDDQGNMLTNHSQGIAETAVVEPLSADPFANYFGFTLVFRRALLDVIPFSQRGESTYTIGASLSHDRWICLLAHSLGRVLLLDEPLAGYRQHNAQLFGAQRRQGWTRGVSRAGASQAIDKLRALQREQEVLTRVCRHRSALFEQAQATSSFNRDQLNRASDFWKGLADRHSLRVRAYRADALGTRVGALSAGLRLGIYSRTTLGYRSFAKDLAICMLGRRVRLDDEFYAEGNQTPNESRRTVP